ncbi:PREDICTED: bone morphogenetic protein 3 [Nanorana parkeri]|uniref:bone morphogenetic protein 3 n=1 Tax=Nanorana parkeri TaxID=125878 RepID=UPI00085460E3|nr:PREDICTED: bone morphogenetic protein 3 [Nanorana parkeri]
MMATECPLWLLLWLGCSSCLCLGELWKEGLVGIRSSGSGTRLGAGDSRRHEEALLPIGDTVSEHMLRLYDKYRGGGRRGRDSSRHQLPLKDGNTVRSFRSLNGNVEDNNQHIFNLTSLTSSENILSATFHYYLGDILNISQRCHHSSSCPRRGHRKPELSIDLKVSSLTSLENQTRNLGNFLINISTTYRDLPSWHWKDITQVLREAKEHGEALIAINMTVDTANKRRKQLQAHKPYILVYANDSAISEPDSVVSNLHGQHASIVHKRQRKEGLIDRRSRRSTDILLPLQNNELPGAEYQYNEDEERWVEKKPYKTLQVRPVEKEKSKKKLRKSGRQKGQTLQFDEHTLKKARRKQWNEPRNCARRYLKVDFADIGWSEWIISPKSFDAYYCSGACQFPMSKSLKPSNHATIQSIVRAVGVVPGIPEPCCVPEKMSSLSILFFDENKNVVLKVYPNMTVESCACR